MPVNNSSLNFFGISLDKTAATDIKGSKNQLLSENSPIQAFKSLLARTAQGDESKVLLEGVKNLPPQGQKMAAGLLDTFPELKELSAEQLVEVMQQLSLASTEGQALPPQMADSDAQTAIVKLIKSIQNATGLQSAVPLAQKLAVPLTQQLAVPAADTSPLLMAQVSAKPIITDAQLVQVAQRFGSAESVAQQVIAGSGVQKVLVDEDLLVLAKEATQQTLSKAQASVAASVNTENAARADIGQILQQMQGRLRVKSELSVAGEAVSKSAAAVTADSFLTSRALGAQQLVQAKLQSEGQLTAPMTRAVQVQLTERPVTTTPFSGAAVQLTALDTSQHANAQLHRVTEQPLAENFNTLQNQERLQRAMGERVMQMVDSGKWDTEMELYPARLGTVRIRMSMENSELQLVMTSQSSAVKELLEAGLPRLRDSLQEQGIQLANSSVQQESAGQQSGSQFAKNGAASDSGSNELSDTHGTDLKSGGQSGGSHDGELDTFA